VEQSTGPLMLSLSTRPPARFAPCARGRRQSRRVRWGVQGRAERKSAAKPRRRTTHEKGDPKVAFSGRRPILPESAN